MEQIETKVRFHGHTLKISGTFWPEEPMTRNYAGSHAQIELESVRINGRGPNIVRQFSGKTLTDLEDAVLAQLAADRRESLYEAAVEGYVERYEEARHV